MNHSTFVNHATRFVITYLSTFTTMSLTSCRWLVKAFSSNTRHCWYQRDMDEVAIHLPKFPFGHETPRWHRSRCYQWRLSFFCKPLDKSWLVDWFVKQIFDDKNLHHEDKSDSRLWTRYICLKYLTSLISFNCWLQRKSSFEHNLCYPHTRPTSAIFVVSDQNRRSFETKVVCVPLT